MPQFFVDPVGSGYSTVDRIIWGNQGGNVNYSYGNNNYSYEGHEVYHRQSGLDKATRNYYIAGLATQVLGNIVGRDNPDVQNFTNSAAGLLYGVGAIREYSNPREVYHRENHEYVQQNNGWNLGNNGYWGNDSSWRMQDQYEYRSGGRHGGHHRGGGSYYEGGSRSESWESHGNNGWNRWDNGGYRNENWGQWNNQGPSWNPWIICY